MGNKDNLKNDPIIFMKRGIGTAIVVTCLLIVELMAIAWWKQSDAHTVLWSILSALGFFALFTTGLFVTYSTCQFLRAYLKPRSPKEKKTTLVKLKELVRKIYSPDPKQANIELIFTETLGKIGLAFITASAIGVVLKEQLSWGIGLMGFGVGFIMLITSGLACDLIRDTQKQAEADEKSIDC